MIKRAESRTSHIKVAQKESAILRLVSTLMAEAVRDVPSLAGISVTHVKLSPGKSLCRIYLYTEGGEKAFQEVLDHLKLYKPSLRKALATHMNARYTPDILFVFDAQLEKTMRIESLLESIKQGADLTDTSTDSSDHRGA